MLVKVKSLDLNARLPQRSYESAGYDVFSCRSQTIPPGSRAEIKLGIACELPNGYAALVWDKGSTAIRGLVKLAGVIDCDYRGEWTVLLHNLGCEPVVIRQGDKVAQILVQRAEVLELMWSDELGNTDRGEKGFGSTGS